VSEKWNSFKQKWSTILTPYQIEKGGRIVRIFPDVQSRLSTGHLTLIHGDVKSPNIFYDKDSGLHPVFIDWQYIAIGKGAQDLVFFLIESFNVEYISLYLPLFKQYYFVKLKENGVNDYEFSEFEQDVKDSICYFPFFVALWFGTIRNDELIDKNFPFFFIQKLFQVIDMTSCCF
jgi:thiamine kinase-like enzyme